MNKILVVLGIVLTSCIWPQMQPAFSETDVTVDYIIAGIQYHQSLIKTAQADYKIEGYLPKEPTKKNWNIGTWIWKRMQGDVSMQGGKEFMRNKSWQDGKNIEEPPTEEWLAAYDGEKTRTWGLSTIDAGSGSIRAGMYLIETYPTPTDFALTVAGVSWLEVINNGTVKLIGTESINNHLCHIITGMNPRGKISYKAWIDIARGFMPLKIVEILKSGDIFLTLDSIELQQFSNDIWFPIKGTTHLGISGYTTRHSVFGNIRINEEISDDVFVSNWSAGTNVWDSVLQMPLTIGDPLP